MPVHAHQPCCHVEARRQLSGVGLSTLLKPDLSVSAAILGTPSQLACRLQGVSCLCFCFFIEVWGLQLLATAPGF